MTDKRVFRAKEVDSVRKGWVADMSVPGGAVNPGAYFFWKSQAQAARFVHLVDQGVEKNEAIHTVHSESKS